MPRSVSELFYFFCCVLYMYVLIFLLSGKKCSTVYVIVSFEKSSNLDSLKLLSTNVCLWKSTQTVLHPKYRFCSKNANQTGNTSSLLVHCLKQYPVISSSNGWSYECQGNWKKQQEKTDFQLAQKQTTINYLFARGTLYGINYWHVEICMGLQSSL